LDWCRTALWQGLLTGKMDEKTTFDSSDFRSTSASLHTRGPQGESGPHQSGRQHRPAEERDTCPDCARLAAGQKPWIVPIPGTTKLHRLDENIGAASVELTPNDLRDIENAASKITVQGARYPEKARANDWSLSGKQCFLCRITPLIERSDPKLLVSACRSKSCLRRSNTVSRVRVRAARKCDQESQQAVARETHQQTTVVRLQCLPPFGWSKCVSTLGLQLTLARVGRPHRSVEPHLVCARRSHRPVHLADGGVAPVLSDWGLGWRRANKSASPRQHR